MIKELLGALLGLAGGFLPEIIKLFKDKQDKKHEIAMIKLQIEAAEKQANQKLEAVLTEGVLKADQMAYEYAPVAQPGEKTRFDSIITTIVYAFNSLVRPVITYLFVGLYMWVKYAQYRVLMATSSNTFEAVVKLWTDTDAGFVAMVIMFWFGGRQIARSMGKLK